MTVRVLLLLAALAALPATAGVIVQPVYLSTDALGFPIPGFPYGSQITSVEVNLTVYLDWSISVFRTSPDPPGEKDPFASNVSYGSSADACFYLGPIFDCVAGWHENDHTDEDLFSDYFSDQYTWHLLEYWPYTDEFRGAVLDAGISGSASAWAIPWNWDASVDLETYSFEGTIIYNFVPEPATLLLSAVGLAAIVFRARRRRG